MNSEKKPGDVSFQAELDACPAELPSGVDRRTFLSKEPATVESAFLDSLAEKPEGGCQAEIGVASAMGAALI